MKFPESAVAHKYLDGLKGIEIGGSAHNPFGIDTINVDISDDSEHTKAQIGLCGEALRVDVIAPGDRLPFEDNSFDFVISSHVIEHFYDPISAIAEWMRVATKYVFMIIPHRDRTYDKDRELTPLLELIERIEEGMVDYEDKHWSVWTPDNFQELIAYLDYDMLLMQDPDDKVGNGFTVILKVEQYDEAWLQNRNHG